MSETDRIERSIRLQAPPSRVWRAISNAEEFGAWFGCSLAGQVFAPGRTVRGPITICGHEHVMFEAIVERVEPERVLAFRWHPYAIDSTVDYSAEPRTLVTLTVAADGAGSTLTVVESGFDAVPPNRRLDAFRANSRGWEAQLGNVARHVDAG